MKTVNNIKGIALIYMALMLLLIGAALVFGIMMMGPQVAKDKRLDTKNKITAAADAVIGFAARNDRLPSVDEFANLVRDSKDIWGSDLVYYPDSLLDDAGETICGRTTTGTTVRNCTDASCTDPTDDANIAFVILSGGENRNIQTLVASATISTYTQGILGIDDYATGLSREEAYKDIMKVVSLNELKVKAGCFGSTAFRIVNSSLPSGTLSLGYSVNVYAENGVPFADGDDPDVQPDYKWCVEAGLPDGLSYDCDGTPLVSENDLSDPGYNPCSLSSGHWNQCTNLFISGVPLVTGTVYLPIFAMDDDANIDQKVFPLSILPPFAIHVCSNYRVWNEFGQTRSFLITDNPCITDIGDDPGIGNGTEITVGVTLEATEVIFQYQQQNSCGNLQNQASFNQAILADTNQDCCVSFVAYGSPDYRSLIDRTCPLGSDNDGDGFTTPADCNDNNASINPAAVEVCDGLDNDCDGGIDEGFNMDGDAYKTCAGDCNDLNASIHPGAAELCNNVDDDCDGLIDESFDADGDGFKVCEGDCNDNNSLIHPGADDSSCNGVDEDCDGTADDNYATTQTTCGFGICVGNDGELQCQDGVVVNTCNPFLGAAANDATCNGIDEDCSNTIDEDYVITATVCGVGACERAGQNQCVAGAVVNTCVAGDPAANDATCNGIDEDCDGVNDEDYVGAATTCGVGVCQADGQNQCVSGDVVNECTPGPPAIESPAHANCGDNFDNDCDGLTDEFDPGCGAVDYFCDMDADTFTSLTPTGTCAKNVLCAPAGKGCVYNAAGDDCNDNDAKERPGQTWYKDTDGDGYSNGITQSQCLRPAGYKVSTELTAIAGDCNDNNAAIKPGASEVCDLVDNNCNGSIDEGVSNTYYRDSDSDSYGTSASSMQACSAPAGYVANNTDCNDSNAAVHPGAPDAACNGIDNDCDGSTDENYVVNSSCGLGICQTNNTPSSCVAGFETLCSAGLPTQMPEATCTDNIDNDCDGLTDAADQNCYCYAGGINVRNSSGEGLYFVITNTQCASWAPGVNLPDTIGTADYLYVRQNNCNKKISCTVDYLYLHPLDSDYDCQVQLTGVSSNNCTFGDE